MYATVIWKHTLHNYTRRCHIVTLAVHTQMYIAVSWRHLLYRICCSHMVIFIQAQYNMIYLLWTYPGDLIGYYCHSADIEITQY